MTAKNHGRKEDAITNANAQATSETPEAAETGAAGATDRDPGTQDRSIAEGSGTGPATEEEIDLYKLGFGVAKSIRYHAKRMAWFERWHYTGNAAAIVSATAAFATVAGQYPLVTSWVAVCLACVTAIDLILGFQRRANIHSNLYQRFSNLAASIATKANPSSDEIRTWQVERLVIEAEEPPNLDTLNVICHNQEAQARGLDPENMYELNLLDHILANVVSVRRKYQH